MTSRRLAPNIEEIFQDLVSASRESPRVGKNLVQMLEIVQVDILDEREREFRPFMFIEGL